MQLKRKGPDDGMIVTDISAAESIPSKKPRQLEEWELPTIFEDRPSFASPPAEVCPVEIPSDTPLQESPVVPLMITEPEGDERAIVLYRPINPPLFPGGPPAGSEDLPIQVNASFPQDFRDFQVTGAVESSPWFSRSKSFKRNAAFYPNSNNSLAVIPYVPPYSVLSDGVRPGSDTYGGRVVIEDITDQAQEEEDAMVVEEPAPMDLGEQMDVMEDVNSAPQPAQPQFMPACEVPSWQLLRPPYTPVMWST